MNRYQIVIDGDDVALDQSHRVNEARLAIAGLPDFEVVAVAPRFSQWIKYGVHPQLRVELRNHGIAQGRQVQVDVYHGDPDALPGPAGPAFARRIGRAYFDTIDPLSSAIQLIGIDLSAVPTGSQLLCVVVNGDSAIWERSEANNKICFNVVIPVPGTIGPPLNGPKSVDPAVMTRTGTDVPTAIDSEATRTSTVSDVSAATCVSTEVFDPMPVMTYDEALLSVYGLAIDRSARKDGPIRFASTIDRRNLDEYWAEY